MWVPGGHFEQWISGGSRSGRGSGFRCNGYCRHAEAVALLLHNSDERERWCARALARASQFSWRKAAEQTLAVYRNVCNSKGSAAAKLEAAA